MSIKKSLGVRQTAEQAEETVSLRSSLDSSAEADEEGPLWPLREGKVIGTVWTPEMVSAAMRDAQNICDLHAASSFLVDRLREYEPTCECEDATREWLGHVRPALSRLEALLAAIASPGVKSAEGAMRSAPPSTSLPDTSSLTQKGTQE